MDVSGDRNISSSVAYSSDNIAWCIARAKHVPRWKNMYIIVPFYYWLLFYLIVFCVAVGLYILLKNDPGPYYSFPLMYIIVLQAVIGQASFFNPRNCCFRIFYLTLLIMGIVSITTYTAFFIKFLTLPIYTRQVESIEEMVSNEYILCGQNETLSFYNLQQDSVRI